MEVFNDYAYYYNAFYKEKDYKEEAAQVDFLLNKYGQNVRKVLNFGCGTGRHDIELEKKGYQCTGIDMSPLMVEIARKNAELENSSMEFLEGDIRRFESKCQYDAVISLFHVMSYQTGNEDILAAFQSARKSLHAGGIFIFDTWYGPGVLSDKPVLRIREAEDEENRLVRIAKPIMHDKENTVDVCYEVFVVNKETDKVRIIKELHSMRYFFKPELKFLLHNAGFELVDHLDCTTLGETDYTSWTTFFIAKAI